MNDHRAYAAAMARRLERRAGERQARLERQWSDEICRALADGELRAVHPESHRPFRPGELGSLLGAIAIGVIALDGFNAWLRHHGVGFELRAKDLAEPAPKYTASSPEVVEKAVDLANRVATRYFHERGSCFPSRDYVVAAITPMLVEFSGKTWDIGTVDRHALPPGWKATLIDEKAQREQN